MSLIIKGKDMPKSCHGCDLFSGEGFLCPLVIETTNDWVREVMYKRVDECQLVEIPTSHGRLIDADELVKKLERHRDMCGDIETQYGIDTAIRILRNIPTIIEAEGVNE